MKSFVAVSSTGTNNRVMTSPEGVNWTCRVPAIDKIFSWVCYGNGKFVAVSTSGYVIISIDGIAWTLGNDIIASNWQAVCFGNGLFVAVSLDGLIMSSPDGSNWTLRTAPVAGLQWQSICYGAGKFVAVANESGLIQKIMTSPNGVDWTMQDTPVTVFGEYVGLRQIIYAANKFALIVSVASICISDDAINWQVSDFPTYTDYYFYSICYGNGRYVAISKRLPDNSTVDTIVTSTDGINWSFSDGLLNKIWRLSYGAGLFVAVGDLSVPGQQVMTSPNGINWILRDAAAANNWNAVCYGGVDDPEERHQIIGMPNYKDNTPKIHGLQNTNRGNPQGDQVDNTAGRNKGDGTEGGNSVRTVRGSGGNNLGMYSKPSWLCH